MEKINKARKAFYDAILQRQKKISFYRSLRASQSSEDRRDTESKIEVLEKQIRTLNKTLRENKVMKVKIKRSVLKQAVRQVMKQSTDKRVINQGAFVDKMKAKFGPNASAFRKWIAQNWEQFERQIMPLVMGGVPKDPNVKQDVGMPDSSKSRYGSGTGTHDAKVMGQNTEENIEQGIQF